MPTRFAFLDSGGPIAFAHRGAAPAGLENTLAAVDRIVGLGFAYLETDVRASADGVAMLLHDARLNRTTDGTGAVAELPWAQISRARVGGREPLGGAGEQRLDLVGRDARPLLHQQGDRAGDHGGGL